MGRILVVDDMIVQQEMLKKILGGNGYEVVGTAKNGAEAIERYRTLKPDLVTMDINMSVMDGISALKEILGLDPSAKVVMCTVEEGREKIKECIRIGAKDYIIKPYNSGVIYSTIDTVMRMPPNGRLRVGAVNADYDTSPVCKTGLFIKEAPPLSDDEFKLFQRLIYDNTGMYFSEGKRYMLTNRLKRRCDHYGLTSYSTYYNFLMKSHFREEELAILFDAITTNKTYFFREKAHFDALKDTILREIMGKKEGNKSLRIWSSACSTGDEPYSVAITVLETTGSERWDVKIYASDISREVLATAREGIYNKKISVMVEGIDRRIIERYFIDEGEYLKVTDEVKKMVQFSRINLKEDFTFRNLDIIFCRNVMIYFDREAQRKLIEKFYKTLNPGGYLIIGRTETLHQISDVFKFTKVGDALVYKKM